MRDMSASGRDMRRRDKDRDTLRAADILRAVGDPASDSSGDSFTNSSALDACARVDGWAEG